MAFVTSNYCYFQYFQLLTTTPRFDVKANLTPKGGLGGEKKKNDIIPHKRHSLEFEDILLEHM